MFSNSAPSAGLVARLLRYSPVLLCFAVVVGYLPSLPGGFLNYDDPWLIVDNPILARGDAGALAAIWGDLSRDTRLALGAEYLPIRDTSLWLEVRLWGLVPQAMRATSLVLYLAAVLAFRRALLLAFENRAGAEVAAWVFALHPAHVESVAWLDGRNEVLALLFVGLALAEHAARPKRRWWTILVLLSLAHLSKSMTVVSVGLLLAQDLWMRRRPELKLYGLVAVVAAFALALHLHVGQVVGFTTAPPGGSRWTAFFSMGPVWLRYLWMSVFPPALSIVHDVAALEGPGLVSIAGWAVVAVWGAGACWLFATRKRRLPLVAWLWFFVPLVPVSQVLFPLQTWLADRYLLFSVMAPAMLLGALVASRPRLGVVASTCAVLAFTLATIDRSALFANSIAVFEDATHKTRVSPVAPYQLGQGHEARGDDRAAIDAYRLVLERSERSEAARRATNNLAKLYARGGKLGPAEAVLREGRRKWPGDPKMLGNLAEVVARQGNHAEARRLYEELVGRFPGYRPGVESYRRRYGRPPPR